MRIKERLLLWTCRDLHSWLQKHYSESDLQELAGGERLGELFVPRWNPYDSPYSADQHLAHADRHLQLAYAVYKRYQRDIWGCCLANAHKAAFGYSMEECAARNGRPVESGENVVETHGMNPFRMLSYLDQADRVSDADTFVQFMVFNALSVVARSPAARM